MRRLGRIRRRDGASDWHLYRDVADPNCFVETFAVPSWLEHMRQHGRGTQVDSVLEREAEALVESYFIRHLVSAVGRRR